MSVVLAFFYLWYGTPEHDGQYTHWNHTVLPHWTTAVNTHYPHVNKSFKPELSVDSGDPLAGIHSRYNPLNGPYSSSDSVQLRSQFKTMASAGIDVACASWWGRAGVSSADSQGTHTDDKFNAVLAAAHESGVKVAFLMEPYAGRSADTFVDDVLYIEGRYSSHPATYKKDTKPVFYVYDSYHIEYKDWADKIMPSVKSKGYYYGLVLERSDIAGLSKGSFDGGFTYFASESMSWAANSRHWLALCEGLRREGLSCDLSISPGYDDTKIRPWNSQNKLPRTQERLRSLTRRALDAGADSISVTSFNEWGEGTQVEPCREEEGYESCEDMLQVVREVKGLESSRSEEL